MLSVLVVCILLSYNQSGRCTRKILGGFLQLMGWFLINFLQCKLGVVVSSINCQLYNGKHQNHKTGRIKGIGTEIKKIF